MQPFNYRLVTNAEDLPAAIEDLKPHAAVGFDTETTSLDPYAGRMRLVQLAAPDGFTYIFDLKRLDPSGFERGHSREAESLAPLRRLLAAPRPVKIAHNAKFDAKWTKHYLGVELGGLFDTLLASQLVSAGDSEDRHGLQLVAERYLGETLDKAAQLSDWSGELSEGQLEYAARDAAVMLPLREKLIERLKADDLVRCASLEFDCVVPVAQIELTGIYLDKERWREQLAVVNKERAALAEELQTMLAEESPQQSFFGPTRLDINLDSHVQLTKALKRLGIEVPDSTRNWKLQPLADKHIEVKKLLEYRHVQKALTSYGENILEEISPHTGRIHANFHQIGAPTGRMSCLAGDTLVFTPQGFKRMDSVTEGDRVKTSYGFKKVEKAWMNGVRQLFSVRLRDGRTIRATADHRFLTGQADTWRQLGELRPGDALFVSLKSSDFEPDAPPHPLNISLPEVRARKTVQLPRCLSPELCELMGLIMADGFLGRRHERPVKRRRLSGTPAVYDRIYLAFDWQDEELIERIVAYSRDLFGQPFVEVKSRTCRVYQLASTHLAQFFAALGLEGNAHTKAVPEIIMRASSAYQAAFLRGLFEGDGYRMGSSIGLTSVNRHLLAQVQLLLSNLGIYSIIHQRADESGFAGSIRFDLKIYKKSDMARFLRAIGFITSRKNRPFNPTAQTTDGISTPFIIPGSSLYREAIAAGTTQASREGIKPFTTFYKRAHIKEESVKKLVGRFGLLPSLKPVLDYLDLKLRPVEIDSITPDGIEEVYDISVEDVHEFIANGIVVHNCTNPNIQQVPHSVEYRRCFRAPEGRKLLISDYSQIELRILADYTGDKGFIEAFNSGADLHRVTAAQIFNSPLEAVTKEQRDFAKRLNFGVVYGIGAQRFSMMTGLSLAEAEDILRRYFATYRGLDHWLRAAAQQAIRERTAPRTVAGRLARFNFDPADKQAVSLAQRNGKNSPIQGSSADIIKRALRLLHDQLKEGTARIVNVVHDEIVVEADAADAESIARTVEDAMCAAGEEYVKKVPVKVETEVADEWVK
ncbi:MAG TPA: DNA polymerase [Pyrinomonadaceae bacterium]|jgi:DNA polymerase I-like protein with 3'-5' exonuclease and polymerase domains/intein/homing endonuclease